MESFKSLYCFSYDINKNSSSAVSVISAYLPPPTHTKTKRVKELIVTDRRIFNQTLYVALRVFEFAKAIDEKFEFLSLKLRSLAIIPASG